MWPRASWRKPPWARSSSVAASATPAIASGFSNWGACSKPQFRAVGQFPITAFTPHLPTALYFPSEVRYAYGVQRAITERKAIVLQCMKAIADGPEIEDWEFHTRLGIVRPTLRRVISLWPGIDDGSDDSDEFLAINNCLNEICHGVDIPPTGESGLRNQRMTSNRPTPNG